MESSTTTISMQESDSVISHQVGSADPAASDAGDGIACTDAATRDDKVDGQVDGAVTAPRTISPPSTPSAILLQKDAFPDEVVTTPKSTDSEVVDYSVSFSVSSDIVIHVKSDGSKVCFNVSSALMSSASPVWRSELRGDGQKGHSETSKWVINIDGDLKALDTVFSIIHHKFNRVPPSVTLDELYEIARVISKYECTHLVYPWGNQWLKDLSIKAEDADCPSHCHKAVFIAWMFGDVKLFRDMVDVLTVSSKLDCDGQLVNVDGKPLKEMVLPSGLSDAVDKTRSTTIGNILAAVNTPLMQLTKTDKGTTKSFCKLSSQQKECEAMMLGSIIPAMMTAGLFPIPDKFPGSIQTLKEKIDNIKPIPYAGRDWKPHLSHGGCNLGFSESVLKCLKDMPVPLQDNFMEHLSAQADISGIKNGPELEEFLCRHTPSPLKDHSVAASTNPTSPKSGGDEA